MPEDRAWLLERVCSDAKIWQYLRKLAYHLDKRLNRSLILSIDDNLMVFNADPNYVVAGNLIGCLIATRLEEMMVWAEILEL